VVQAARLFFSWNKQAARLSPSREEQAGRLYHEGGYCGGRGEDVVGAGVSSGSVSGEMARRFS
jgi:hypothetical protein